VTCPLTIRGVCAPLLITIVVVTAAAGFTRDLVVISAVVGLVTGAGLLVVQRALGTTREAIATARRLATGDLDARMPVGGTCETRELAAALNGIGDTSARREGQLNRALDDAANQRDLFYSIINASSDGLLLYDNDQQLLAANSRCGELLGFSFHELLNTEISVLQRTIQSRCEEPDHYRPRLAAHFGAGDRSHQDHLVLCEPRRRVLRRYSCPIVNQHGVRGRVFTYTDVTTETDIDRLKSEFVSMASHELRTPLTSVHGALQLALSGSGRDLDEEDRELLEISLANTERLVRLVNDLLDLSKIEAGRMPFALAPVPVARLLDDAARAMHGLAATRDSRIFTDAGADLPEVAGDRDHLMRVLINLVSNAVKYSPPGSRVRLSARPVTGGVEIAVEDQGPGIRPDQLDRLFRPFSRVGLHERQTTGGTGLGLAISRAIVEQHGGRIWVEPGQPSGSRFTFVLPLAEAHETPEVVQVA
jgi:signal transduction histidine kinase